MRVVSTGALQGAHSGGRASLAERIPFIAANRQWTRHYQMKVSLVKHPKCPLHHVMSFMKMLRCNDFRLLARDKDVSPGILKLAKNLLAKPK
ncbi:MAG: hypothetical protein EXR76_11395 [Myxococcales bacterium]|nr:hypothetical protein [Myxococcales bacterium]